MRLDEVVQEIEEAVAGGWISRQADDSLAIATRDGRRDVAQEVDGQLAVVTALGRGYRAGGTG